MTIIHTKTLTLRHLKAGDLEGFYACQQDKDTQKNFMAPAKTLAEAKQKLQNNIAEYKKKKPESETFAIIVNNQFAGFVAITHMHQDYFHHRAGIGYAIHPDFRGQGIATTAVKLATAHAFKTYPIRRIEGFCRTWNKASQRVLEKAGYHHEGTLRKNKCKDGKYLDDVVYAKVK